MQSASWYARRLRAMSPRELGWRLGAQLQRSVDRCVAPLRRERLDLNRIAAGNGEALTVGRGTAGLHLACSSGRDDPASDRDGWRSTVVAEAEKILRNRLDLFHLTDLDLGPEVNWNYEYEAQRPTPVTFAPAIDYRDYAVTGDAKLVWEPNRHQHLVVLGRAYRLSGDRRYAEKAVHEIEGWIRQCPFGMGMNWRSPLELAIRLINWVWTYELIDGSGAVTSEHMARVLSVAYRHLWDISRKYSRYSSANNHLVGEAAGVFIGSTYFASLKHARMWQARSREILLREIIRQTHGDGGHRELAMGYHLFVLEFFLLAGLVARNVGEEFPAAYWERLERMFEFVAAFAEGGEPLPMFNDCDDGYVLRLSEGRDRVRNLLGVGAVLFGRRDFKDLAADSGEAVYWLLGPEGHEFFRRMDAPRAPDAIRSRALAGSGFYLLQSGALNGSDRVSVAFDCGALGFGSIAAHGHADALSFTLRASGMDVFVDPGTYDYFTYPDWRNYFRSTRAHNTIVVDGCDQSEMLGPFLWGRRASARCIRWEPKDDGGTVSGEHDGYARLADPVIHRRTIVLAGRVGEVVITDELIGEGQHTADQHFHLAERCQLRQDGPNLYGIDCGATKATLRADPRLAVEVFRASEAPRAGWSSRGYHDRRPSATLVGHCRWRGRMTLVTRIELGRISG
jgi:hypothetical protein